MPLGPNAGYRLFNTGDILTAAQVQNNLQNQSVMFFASAAARDADTALTAALTEGMFCYLADTDTTLYYDGTAWQSFGTGDVTGLTAGAGITITNPGGPVPTIAVADNPTLTSPKETANITAVAATGAIDLDVLTASVNIRTVDATGNWTINVRGDVSTTLDSIMTTGEQISVVFESPQGATAYYPTAFNVDGSAVTPLWLGGTAPSSGNINSNDVYVYTIRKTGAATFTVLASQNKYA
jgi:hypothetical protein